MIEKILSGGQTGVDQAALEIALQFNIPHGGWCPKGRLAENGTIPPQYKLTETASSDYSVRTKLNIRDADGTLILISHHAGEITNGTLLTIQEAKEKKKPYLVIDLSQDGDIDAVVQWASDHDICVLNIAGPRESQSPGINKISKAYLEKILPLLSVPTVTPNFTMR